MGNRDRGRAGDIERDTDTREGQDKETDRVKVGGLVTERERREEGRRKGG